MIEDALQSFMPEGWTVCNIHRERQCVGEEPPILWWVTAENEDEDYIKGYGATIEEALISCVKCFNDGFIQKSEWRQRHAAPSDSISKITLISLGLGSQNPKPRLTFRRPNAPPQTPTSTEG